MNIDFTSTHLETLCDLKAIAEKHNCRISFGVDSFHEYSFDEDILKQIGFTDEDIKFIENNTEIDTQDSTHNRVWFELVEKDTGKVNSLIYSEGSTLLIINKDDYIYRDEDISEELMNKLEEHDQCWDYDSYSISESYNPTIIYGFGNKGRVEDYRVYRSGMALKFFGDLVCDYLGEPRIDRVY